MNASPEPRPTSARIALARAAEVVLALDTGVQPTIGGGRWVTVDGRRPIAGVVATGAGDGTVELELHLTVRWPAPSLRDLAEKLRTEVWREAGRAGLGERLGAVTVSFDDLALPDPGEDEETP